MPRRESVLFVSIVAEVCILITSACVSAYLLNSLYSGQKRLIDAGKRRYESYLLADQLRQSSDDLSRMVRTFAATGEPKYERQFRDVLAIRNGKKPRPVHYERVYWDFMAAENPLPPFVDGEAVSLEDLMRRSGFTEEEFRLLAISKERSDKLVGLEEIAFNAMHGRFLDDNGEYSTRGEADPQMALGILFGEDYHEAKKGIMKPINGFFGLIDRRTARDVDRNTSVVGWLLSALIVSFAGLIVVSFVLLGTTNRYHRLMVGQLKTAIDEKSEKIVEIKRLAGEGECLIAELEAKNTELERFTYTVSHDLKSPLITITGFAGQLQQDLDGGDLQRGNECLPRIIGAANRMGELLKDLLELSRVGRIVSPPTKIRFQELACPAVEVLSGIISKKGVSVTVDDVPDWVFGDRVRLGEVFQNLIENAVKFMGDQPDPRIKIGVRTVNDETVVYVEDNGSGIDPAYQEQVFGLFDQLDPSAEGTGVGLALVKRIVEFHGGRIWIESEGPGKGTTVNFSLPEREDT